MSDGARDTTRDGTLVGGVLVLAGRLDTRFFALLAAIEATGSIHKAARTAGYSYKGAWLVLDTAGNLALSPLLETATGGRGGGGTRLTPAGRALLAAWRDLETRHAAFLREQDARLAHDPALAGLLRRLSMKTTARNQFAGRIRALEKGPATTQVVIALPGDTQIVASVTTASAEAMKLRKGQEALAIVKAPSVVLVTDLAGWRLSARNQLAGTISRVQKGAVSSLVAVTLPGGATVTATVTNDAVDALALAAGQPATAAFKASAVMVAVAD